jgi:hypothetical protein
MSRKALGTGTFIVLLLSVTPFLQQGQTEATFDSQGRPLATVFDGLESSPRQMAFWRENREKFGRQGAGGCGRRDTNASGKVKPAYWTPISPDVEILQALTCAWYACNIELQQFSCYNCPIGGCNYYYNCYQDWYQSNYCCAFEQIYTCGPCGCNSQQTTRNLDCI